MSKVVAGFLAPCPQKYSFCGGDSFSKRKWMGKLNNQDLQWHRTKSKPSYQSVMAIQATRKAYSYSSKIATDYALNESPQVSFDEYLEDMPRVFEAVFPNKKGSERISEEEWRLEMIPMKILFLTSEPVVNMRLKCKSEGRDYPPEVPCDIAKVLELDMTRWELQGLENSPKPSAFVLGVKGAMYADRREQRSRLKGQLEMSISFVPPPMIAFIPEHVLQSIVDSVLRKLVQEMTHQAVGGLLEDYSKFARDRAENVVQTLK